MPVHYERFVLQNIDGETVATLPTTRRETLLECLLRYEVRIRTACRGSLICGGCRVDVVEGLEALPPPNPSESELLRRYARGNLRTRLACQITIPEGLDQIVVSTRYW